MNKNLLTLLLTLFIFSSGIAQVCAPDFYALEDTISCGDSTYIVFVNPGGSETFDCTDPATGLNMPCSAGWSSVGTQFDEPYIPSPDGAGYMWMGPSTTQPRAFTTPVFNTVCGGQICFDFVYADGNSGAYNPPINGFSTPEQPDLYNEGIALQYKLPGGAWTDMRYWAPNGDILPANPGSGQTTPSPPAGGGPFETWQDDVCMAIPPVAVATAVQFRFFQEFGSSECCDHWGIDDVNVSINTDQMDGFMSTPTPSTTPITSPDSILVFPTQNTEYTFIVTDASYGGTYVGYDTVNIYIEETDAGPDMQVSCSTIGVELAVGGVNANATVTWSPNDSIDDVNSHTPYVNPDEDTYYVVQSACGIDSTFINVVPIFNTILSATEDSICAGDVTTLTANTDQPTSSYTYQWSPASVSNDTIQTTNAFPSINTTYYIEMVSDSGCVRQDSIDIFVGVVPKNIDYIGEQRICRGDSTQITAVPTPLTFYDDFEIGAAPGIWQFVNNGYANTDCGSVSGNALHFDSTGVRSAQLYPVDASLGGTISFWLIYGSGAIGSPCADVSFNAEMRLEYSIDGGATWVQIREYQNFQHDTWALQSDTIPAAAQTTSTIFRLIQDNNGGNNDDNWAIDEFILELNCSGTGCTQYTYNWTPSATVSNPNIENPYFFPETSTWYSLIVSPEGFNCNVAADSVLVSVDELNITINPSDTFLCEPDFVPLDAQIEGFSESCDEVYLVSNIPYNLETNTSSTPLVFSSSDDGQTPPITIPFDFEFFCQNVSSVIVNSNGVVNMQDNGFGNSSLANNTVPNTNIPNGFIALMWDDLITSSGTYFINGTAPNRKMVFNFDSNHFGSSVNVDGQIVLHETTNIIDITCIDCQQDNFPSATQGIENYDGTVGFATPGRNNTAWSATNETWRYIPSNSPANFQYSWSPNIAITDTGILNPFVNPTTSTDYVLSVYNINNCLFTDTMSVELYQSNTTLTPNQTLCFGDSVQLEATGADTYAWTPNIALSDSSIADPKSGTNTDIWYYVTYNTQGCEEVDSVFIDILNLPQAVVNNGDNPVNFCEGTSVDLFVSNPSFNTYTWTGPETGTGTTLNVSTQGTYNVEYFDGNCTNATTVNVQERPNPVFDFSNVNKNLCCEDDSLVVNFADILANGNNINIDKIYWNGMEVSGSSYTYYSEDANFVQQDVVKVISNFGCEGEGELAVKTNCLNPSFTNPDTVYANAPETFDLTVEDNGADNISYAWSTTEPNGNTNAIVDPNVEDAVFNGATEGGPYEATVSVVATYGTKQCSAEVSSGKNYQVVVVSDPMYPNAFSPNADGLNDVFRPVINSLANITEMRVYDRWGDLVYDMETNENKNGWDGKFLGKDQAPGVYTYYTKIIHPDGKEFLYEGQVNLVR